MIDIDSRDLVDAIRIWSGWGIEHSPRREDSRLARQRGNAFAMRLLPIIKELQKDFYASDAHLRASDLTEMGQIAKEQFKKLHPRVAEEVAEIFVWCYTFDWR
jgi:hypothetical protein